MSHSAIVVAAVSSAASTVGYVIYKDYSRYRRMVDTFATGNMLEPFKVCRKKECVHVSGFFLGEGFIWIIGFGQVHVHGNR